MFAMEAFGNLSGIVLLFTNCLFLFGSSCLDLGCMNKGRRNELRELHYRRRLKNYRIQDDTKGNFHAFKTTGKPCSGICCQQPENNYNRAKMKQSALHSDFEGL